MRTWRIRCDANGRELTPYYTTVDGDVWEGTEAAAAAMVMALSSVAIWREFGYVYIAEPVN